MAKASPTQPKLTSESPCPCGTGRTYGTCCEPVLKQARPAANAEELMRSRYTAHAVGDHRHLHRTYLESSRLPYVEDTDAPELKWQRLVVHAHEPGSSPDQAFVDFTAYYTDQGTEYPLAEKSEFRRINGQWFYTRTVRTGPAPIKSAGPKVGRNEPCPCGSGKKFKQCCGR